MKVFDHTLASMNTRLSLLAPGLARDEGESLVRAMARLLDDQERLMSRFRPDAELFAVNAQAQAGPVRVSAALWTVLAACADHWRRTEGAFDIACGPIEGQAGHGTFGDVRLDRRRRSVSFTRRGLKLDLGAIGKGLALRRVDRLLRRRRIAHAFVSFGESSILTVGPRPCGGDWEIGLDAPPGRDGLAPALSIRDGSISTSGQADGRAPVIDPVSGRPTAEARMVSVACGCPIDAEVLSTALLVRPAHRARILSRYRPARAVEVTIARPGGVATSQVVWNHG